MPREFILGECKCAVLSEMTNRRLRVIWKRELRSVLSDEYESSADDGE